ncbi:MAG TPA: ABC transporter permease [Thiothrix sp.]|nr:ABC transporter permease [Thiothrix sp.]
MNSILTIAGTEFSRFFRSPLAWSLLAIMQFIFALVFFSNVDEYRLQIQPAIVGMENAPGVTDVVVAGLYLWIAVVMMGVMPILTMRLFAEERMNHTLPLLLSAPISSTEIVLGKYFGILAVVLLMVALFSLMPLSLAWGTALDWGVFASAVLGLSLLLASFAAAGLFLSSLTRQPIIAAISSFGLLIFLVILYILGNAKTTESVVFIHLSHFSHFLAFLQGIVESSAVAYYLLFISGFLILTIRKLANDRLQG